jgi:hypothetical protein
MLRALSLLFGMIAIAWTYRLGRDLLSPRAGLYAAIVIATSGFFIHFLHELRMYTLFALLTAFTLWVYWRIIHMVGMRTRRSTSLHYFGLLAGAVGMLYIHYFAALPLIAIGIYHLIFVPKNKHWWQIVGVMALAGVLFLPWVGALIAGLNRAAEADWVKATVMPPLLTLERLAHAFSNGNILLLIIVLLVALLARRRGAREVWFFAIGVLILVLVANAATMVMTPARLRYLMVLWPMLALVVALALEKLERWRYAPALVLALWIAPGVVSGLTPDYVKSLDLDSESYVFPWQLIIHDLRPKTQPYDAVVVHLPDKILSVPASRNQVIAAYYLEGMYTASRVVEAVPEDQEAETLQTSLDFVDQTLRVWSGHEIENPPPTLAQFEAALTKAGYGLCQAHVQSANMQFDLYTRSEVCCLPAENAPSLLRFGDDISIIGLEPLPETTDAHNLSVIVGWRIGAAVPPYKYSVALHVLDAENNLVAQADYPLLALPFACQEVQIDISSLSPGDYTINAIVYAWETGERLTGEVVETGVVGERLLIGQFEVRGE